MVWFIQGSNIETLWAEKKTFAKKKLEMSYSGQGNVIHAVY